MSEQNQIIKFARIIFLDSKNKHHIYPIEDVRYNKTDTSPINPIDKTDFKKNLKYYVKYYLCSVRGEPCIKDHQHIYLYYPAVIYSLGGIYKSFVFHIMVFSSLYHFKAFKRCKLEVFAYT